MSSSPMVDKLFDLPRDFTLSSSVESIRALVCLEAITFFCFENAPKNDKLF